MFGVYFYFYFPVTGPSIKISENTNKTANWAARLLMGCVALSCLAELLFDRAHHSPLLLSAEDENNKLSFLL